MFKYIKSNKEINGVTLDTFPQYEKYFSDEYRDPIYEAFDKDDTNLALGEYLDLDIMGLDEIFENIVSALGYEFVDGSVQGGGLVGSYIYQSEDGQMVSIDAWDYADSMCDAFIESDSVSDFQSKCIRLAKDWLIG